MVKLKGLQHRLVTMNNRRLHLSAPLVTIFAAIGCATPPPATTGRTCCALPPPAPATAPATASLYDMNGTWETDDGRTIHLWDLRGKSQVFAMFYANCEGSCALTLEQLQRIEASLSARQRPCVGFVMVTFEPALDTAQKLHEYRVSRGLSSNWTLLRGDAKTTECLARQLRVTYVVYPPHRLVHSSGITVVGPDGKIASQQVGLHPDLNVTLASVSTP